MPECNHCQCGDREPVTREDALSLSEEFLRAAAGHVDGGRVSEGQLFNQMAQTALALAERLPVVMPDEGPIH